MLLYGYLTTALALAIIAVIAVSVSANNRKTVLSTYNRARNLQEERQDTYTNLNPECIELVRDILRSAVFMFDKAGKIF